VAAGIALAVLVVGLWVLVGRDKPPPFLEVGQMLNQPPDLSTMAPREAADRLFNRIMTAAEGGDSQAALRFVPMALKAYERLAPLDNDARYHVGLIHATAGDLDGTRADIAMLRQSVPDHLLAIMLEHTIAKQLGDQDAAAHAYKTFLAAYDAEIVTGRVGLRRGDCNGARRVQGPSARHRQLSACGESEHRRKPVERPTRVEPVKGLGPH
jgi:hypothetical protein